MNTLDTCAGWMVVLQMTPKHPNHQLDAHGRIILDRTTHITITLVSRWIQVQQLVRAVPVGLDRVYVLVVGVVGVHHHSQLAALGIEGHRRSEETSTSV